MVPDGWEKKKISEIVTSYSGGTPARANLKYYSGTIPWVKSGELNKIYIQETEEFLTEEGFKNSSAKWVPTNSILIAMYGATAGIVGYLQIKATINQAILALIPLSSVIGKFLFFLMNFMSKNILNSIQGSGQPNLNATIINSQSVLLPPLPEQKKIAEILTSVDDTIQSTQAVIEQTKKVKQGLMQELLTKGIGHTKFKQVKLNEQIVDMPEEWIIIRIEDILSACDYGISTALTGDDTQIPVLRMGNIQNDRLDLNSLKYADLTNIDPNKVLLHEDEIILNRTNSKDLVGKVAFIEKEHLPLSFSSYLIRLRVNERVYPKWLFYKLSSPSIQMLLKSISTPGVSQVNINPTKMRALEIAVPSMVEQKMMIEMFSSVDVSIQSNQSKLTQLQTLKKGLMQELLTGKVRVKI